MSYIYINKITLNITTNTYSKNILNNLFLKLHLYYLLSINNNFE